MKRLIATKKFKLPRKVLRDCNSVNHVKVPRKLRSAMMKRNGGSVSPTLPNKRKQNDAINVQVAGEEGKKKSRINAKDESVIVQITEDEEEVAETLFSLSQTFPNNSKSGFARKSPPLAPENEQSLPETVEPKGLVEPPLVYVSNNFESEPSMITKSKQLVKKEAPACETNPDIAAAIAAAVGSLQEQQFTIDKSKNIGVWPGLPSAVSISADTKGSLINCFGSSNPAWMSLNASETQPDSSIEDSRDPFVRNKSWKRCLAHVHISRLIKSLQTAAKTNYIPMQLLDQLAIKGGSQQEADIDTSAAEKNQKEIRNAFLLQEPSPTSTLCTSSKQSFDFLTLSTGGGELGSAAKTATRTGNLIEPWATFHIPYLQSISQNHTNIPFNLPQGRYPASPFTDNFPATAAKQVQMLPQSYSGNPISDPTQLPSLQYQQINWASQFASQYKPMGHSGPHNNHPNTQNRKQDPRTSVPFSQSLELLHPMYMPMIPQQQGHNNNLIPLASSLSSSRSQKRPYRPSGYEGNPDFSLPMHLM